ncbi:polysaccharide biosynthesis protein [Thalassotalea agarivorans]|uniref:NDP-sugar epimerase, includes UDP-GlcNAc-inverting 4,6-dehydratase FlaA1 and capsular polysaccharide biosynthesis protein EpsC n=1 Tax=Thalassotalea agarivorans TaxID=349064 RepID=A0A1H9Y1S3_THASX|nr:nucleoside-diphosphate sugar epimerase/dehydratase [Thalassotalea agarivorans]SES62596.1 NDP-sugar epimerase, includes UDP-GlcNAc-inverting 4,6-dehydratase FlaA1 and capsular polysaccharide biosynthesis protein EpsC [Thalassotalea agarivorans]
MDKIFKLPRYTKRIISVLIDTVFIVFAFWAAMVLRLESLDYFTNVHYWAMLAIVVVVSILINIVLRLYRSVMRYLGSKAFAVVITSVLFSSFSVWLVCFNLDLFLPRSVPIIYCAILLVLIGGSRLSVRTLATSINRKTRGSVIIYGAGDSGTQLMNALNTSREYRPVAFVDDNPALRKLSINNIRVYEVEALEKLIKKHKVKRVLLAIPSASKSRRAEILNTLEAYAVEVLAIPSFSNLVSGKSKIDDLVEVSIEDLLGRDPVPPNTALMHANIKDKVVMVTGAGGSIGSELCRQIIQQQPSSLLLFELNEYALYAINKELEQVIREQELAIQLVPLIGSVNNRERLNAVMRSFKVNTIYHAAAFKHVPLVEHNVCEGVRNNTFGTLKCAQAAIANKVETFVLISTDKAVRPTNVMGTTKRMAELCLQALANKNDHSTRFCMVRFGNVLGSSGSVVPLFKQQIAIGGPITLTHKDITRYFMTIPEAAQLVIQAGAMGKGGDVFVLDMGEPVKIYDLAYKLIHLSGLHLKHQGNPHGDIEIVETGLRPGEKLFEELLIGDGVERTSNERIMTANEVFLPWPELEKTLAQLKQDCDNLAFEAIRETLINAPTAFTPVNEISDFIYIESNQQ